MDKPFNLEAFKAGQKALTRDGRMAQYAGWCDGLDVYHLIAHIEGNSYVSTCTPEGKNNNTYDSRADLVSMISRHQHLIDAYNPEDTWQVRSFDRSINDDFETVYGKPSFDEMFEYRLHPHNDLIKAWKKGVNIEQLENSNGNDWWLEQENPTWNENEAYRIKPELEFTYPIYKQSKYSGVVVEFTDLTKGKVVGEGANYKIGHIQNCWIPHTDTAQWQDWTPSAEKPTTYCLAYDTKVAKINFQSWTAPVVVTKQVAIEKGWKIIQEWGV